MSYLISACKLESVFQNSGRNSTVYSLLCVSLLGLVRVMIRFKARVRAWIKQGQVLGLLLALWSGLILSLG